MAGGMGGGGIGGGGGTDPKEQDPEAPQATVSEEVLWRARAVRAESRIEELEAQLAEVEAQLQAAHTEANARQQRGALELELALSEAIDLDTATLLAERILETMEQPDAAAAVARLRMDKPFLFKPSARASAMSGRPTTPSPASVLDEMAEEARESGDRSALLRYLRARRGA